MSVISLYTLVFLCIHIIVGITPNIPFEVGGSSHWPVWSAWHRLFFLLYKKGPNQLKLQFKMYYYYITPCCIFPHFIHNLNLMILSMPSKYVIHSSLIMICLTKDVPVHYFFSQTKTILIIINNHEFELFRCTYKIFVLQ